MMIIIKCCIPS